MRTLSSQNNQSVQQMDSKQIQLVQSVEIQDSHNYSLSKLSNKVEETNFDEKSQVLQHKKNELSSRSSLGGQKRISQLRRQENETREKLRDIIRQQKVFTKKRNSQYDSSISPGQTNTKLRELTLKYRKFKQDILEKSRLIEEEQQQYKINKKRLQYEQLRTKCAQKRKIIEDKLQIMADKKKQRLKDFMDSKQMLKKLHRKKLHEKMVESFNQRINQLYQEKLQNYEQIKKKKYVDMSGLWQHQQFYEIKLAEKQENRTVRLKQSRVLPQLSHYRSVFYQSVVAQEQNSKSERDQKIQRAKNIMKKHRQYYENVKQEHPLLFRQFVAPRNPTILKQPLQKQEFKKNGNRLFLQGQSHISKLEVSPQTFDGKQNSIIQKKIYPNYLPSVLKDIDINKARSSQNKKKILNRILQQDNKTKLQKLEGVEVYVNQLQGQLGPNIPQQQRMLEILKLKMEILNQLS